MDIKRKFVSEEAQIVPSMFLSQISFLFCFGVFFHTAFSPLKKMFINNPLTQAGGDIGRQLSYSLGVL